MPLTHKLIASTTIGTNTSTVTFSSIPSTYDHLLVKTSVRTNRNADGYADVSFYFNGDQGTNQYKVGGFSGGNSGVNAIGITTNNAQSYFLMSSVVTSESNYQYYFANGEIFIPNYKGSQLKIGRWESHAPNWQSTANKGIMRLGTVSYNSTSAITSISFRDDNSATMQQYSTFELYGLVNS
jgi:hypothetical protein